jgi:2-polyprenyl-6-methoxyphenol hydroxylase-like FAD-dependent oxidoreductase
MEQPTVLISGAGVAGPVLAYWLAYYGFRPTVVERAGGQRSSGNPVDVRGAAIDVAQRMGVLERVREVATSVTGMAFVDASGRPVARMRLGANGGEAEVLRSDLAAILYRAARDQAEFVFGDSVTGLRQDAGGVDVTFEHAAPRRFDLVVGTDGLHSTVRRLVFGPESGYTRHLGMYVSTLPLGRPAADPATVLMYNRPGRSVSVHPANGNAMAAFIFRRPAVPGLDIRDSAACKQVVLDAYRDGGWQLPDLLGQLSAADDFYFDSVSQVRLPTWSSGRVTLLGDAASCMSLFGNGTSLAISGAATLAQSLDAAAGDYAAAFRAYETRHRTQVKPTQRGRLIAGLLLVPSTRTGIGARNLAVRLMPQSRTPAGPKPAGRPESVR